MTIESIIRLGLNTHRLLSFAVTLSSFTLATQAAMPASQWQALVNLYNSTNGVNWKKKTNWMGSAGTECIWYGIACDSAKRQVT
jgi:hypothetical protein